MITPATYGDQDLDVSDSTRPSRKHDVPLGNWAIQGGFEVFRTGSPIELSLTAMAPWSLTQIKGVAASFGFSRLIHIKARRLILC
jgi:hypothetical protein